MATQVGGSRPLQKRYSTKSRILRAYGRSKEIIQRIGGLRSYSGYLTELQLDYKHTRFDKDDILQATSELTTEHAFKKDKLAQLVDTLELIKDPVDAKIKLFVAVSLVRGLFFMDGPAEKQIRRKLEKTKSERELLAAKQAAQSQSNQTEAKHMSRLSSVDFLDLEAEMREWKKIDVGPAASDALPEKPTRRRRARSLLNLKGWKLRRSSRRSMRRPKPPPPPMDKRRTKSVADLLPGRRKKKEKALKARKGASARPAAAADTRTSSDLEKFNQLFADIPLVA